MLPGLLCVCVRVCIYVCVLVHTSAPKMRQGVIMFARRSDFAPSRMCTQFVVLGVCVCTRVCPSRRFPHYFPQKRSECTSARYIAVYVYTLYTMYKYKCITCTKPVQILIVISPNHACARVCTHERIELRAFCACTPRGHDHARAATTTVSLLVRLPSQKREQRTRRTHHARYAQQSSRAFTHTSLAVRSAAAVQQQQSRSRHLTSIGAAGIKHNQPTRALLC